MAFRAGLPLPLPLLQSQLRSMPLLLLLLLLLVVAAAAEEGRGKTLAQLASSVEKERGGGVRQKTGHSKQHTTYATNILTQILQRACLVVAPVLKVVLRLFRLDCWLGGANAHVGHQRACHNQTPQVACACCAHAAQSLTNGCVSYN